MIVGFKPVEENKGLITAKSRGNELIIRTKILKNSLEFNFAHTTVKTKITYDVCFAEFNNKKDISSSSSVLPGIKHALRRLVKDEQLVFDSGIMAFGNYTYSFVVLENGFALHLEIMPDDILSFGVVHESDGIVLAKEQGAWNIKSEEQEVVSVCTDYHDALQKILIESDMAHSRKIKEYTAKFKVN